MPHSRERLGVASPSAHLLRVGSCGVTRPEARLSRNASLPVFYHAHIGLPRSQPTSIAVILHASRCNARSAESRLLVLRGKGS